MRWITPIVEGHGEVKAFPRLLYRLIAMAGVTEQVGIKDPVRINRSVINRPDGLKKGVELAAKHSDAILILVDSDDDCPARRGREIARNAQGYAGDLPCSFVFAHREYEVWFLAAVESIAAKFCASTDAIAPPDPESIRDAKGRLRELLGIEYAPTVHQDKLSSEFDLATAHRSCRSFRKLVHEFGEILDRWELRPNDWPPGSWSEG